MKPPKRSGVPGYFIVIALALISALAAPWLGTNYQTSFLFFLFISITMAVTYDILGGYMGYMNLGHAAFFGIGAYAYGIVICYGGHTIIGMACAPLAAMLFAGCIGYPLFRLRGAYFAIATFGVLGLMYVFAVNLRDITGGTTGISIPPTDNSTAITYYLALAVCIAAVGLSTWLANSRVGLGLLTIREDEEVANSSGVNTDTSKLWILVLSAALPGVAGAIYMWQTTYIDPESGFGPSGAFTPVIMSLLGGSGTIIGPIVGALFLTLVQETLWSHIGYLQLTMYGVVLVIVGIFMPKGFARNQYFCRLYVALRAPDHYGYHPSKLLGRKREKHEGG